MVKQYFKKAVAIALAAALIVSTSGCQMNIVGTDAAKIPLQPALTQQEVIDYYAKALDYDTVVSRAVETNKNTYVVNPVENVEKRKQVEDALAETTKLLQTPDYTATEDTQQYLSDSLYNYVRAALNDKLLTNGQIKEMSQALGYYFVDVEYDISAAPTGTFKPAASLLGMNGAFHYQETTNTDYIDNLYVSRAINGLNDYYTANNLGLEAKYDTATQLFSISQKQASTSESGANTNSQPANGDAGETTGNLDNTEVPVTSTPETTSEANTAPDTTSDAASAPDTASESSETSTLETPSESQTGTTGSSTYKMAPRTTGVDLNLLDKVVGYGNYSSYVPKLDMVHEQTPNTSGICGIGLYPSGSFGLANFGFDRDQLSGKCTLRFLFKEELTNPSNLSCENIYVKYYQIDSGINAENDNNIPDFLKTEFESLIERADRAVANVDITGLINGNIFNDIGMGVLVGYTSNFGNVTRQISTLRRIISRDIEKNSYLVEIERYRTEGAKSADVYASYKDTINAVIEQDGDQFVITDWIVMDRQLVTEPDINPDSETAKRIVSLGLTGEVSEENKTAVSGLLNDLYTASSYRILNGPQTVDNGTADTADDVTVYKGMYDCFDSNVEMLSSSKKEELNANIRSLLVKFGTGTSATMNGAITQWIGGADNQVELTTEEVINYQGRDEGVYMTCYYLMSNMENEWVIDDIQILSKEELNGEGLKAVVDRINQSEVTGTSVVDYPDSEEGEDTSSMADEGTSSTLSSDVTSDVESNN